MAVVSFYNLPAVKQYLLDIYTGATAAYSLRKLRDGYTGNAIRIRRASDNAEQDIGFTGEDLDTAAVNSFCSGTNGFIATWYDQSGNTRNALQTSAAKQPKIFDSSTNIILLNNKPCIDFDGSDDRLDIADDATLDALGINGQYQIAVFSIDVSNLSNITAKGPFRPGLKDSFIRLAYANNTSNTAVQTINQLTLSTQYVGGFNCSAIISGNTDVDLIVNGAIENSGTVVAGNYNNIYDLYIGAGAGITSEFDGKIQEVIIYDTDRSATRAAIETNINNYYNIYP